MLSAVATTSPFSYRITTVALGEAFPETVMGVLSVKVSSDGEVMVRLLPVDVDPGVGEMEVAAPVIAAVGEMFSTIMVGVGVPEVWGRFFKLLLAIQTPKIMMMPKPKPMTMAMPIVAKKKTNVAEDVLSAAKSMFHAVLPK